MKKKETINARVYDCPAIEVIDIKAESVICVSDGENEGTGEDDWGNG